MQDGNVNLDENLDVRAEFAADFMSTVYGQNVINRMAMLAYNRHEQAEKVQTSEECYGLVREAAGIREAMNLIVAEAQLVSDGTLKDFEKQQEEQQKDAALAID